jgi:hypothetical protein
VEAVVASWDSGTLSVGLLDGASTFSLDTFSAQEHEQEETALPELPDTYREVQALLWPLEDLIVRSFALPLPNLRLLDTNILGQELEDQCGEPAEDWWIAWQAKKIGDRIEGLMFALPLTAKESISQHQQLANCTVVWPDGWVRLTSILPAEEESPLAVLDADEQGLFLGLFRDGIWKGLRRLNFTCSRPMEDIADDILLSLSAMGYSNDLPVIGLLDESLLTLLQSKINWSGDLVNRLPSRAEANIRAATGLVDLSSGSPNFRHTTWSAKASWMRQFSPWRRAAVMALILVAFSFSIDLYSLSVLNARVETLQQNIKTVFRQALPDEKVIIDPVAQLRNVVGAAGNDAGTWHYLRQLEAVAKLKKQFPDMQLREVSLIDGGMVLSGTITDFAMVNRARDALAQLVDAEVKVDDTELEKEKKQVRFRLRWS